jgi:2'-5' RNA ligase
LPPPVFTSFDDAWRWFVDGGALVPIEEQRARFTEGRAQFLSFQARVTDPQAVDFARDVQDALEEIEGVTPFADDLLHISILGVGFQVIEARRPNDVLRQDVPSIAERAAKALRGAKPVGVELGPVNVFPDALILEVHDGGGLKEIRRALEAVTRADAFGFEEATYLPHTTIATFTDASPADALREALPPLRDHPSVAMRIARIELTRWWLTGVELTEPPEADVLRSYALRG